MQEVALGTGVAQLIRLIGLRQPREPAIESVNEPVRPCLHFPSGQEVEHNQPLFVHACTEASKPSLPLLPTRDGAVHDTGHEDEVNSSEADWDSQKVRLCEEEPQALCHGLLRTDAQAFPVDIEAYDEKASLRWRDGLATHAGSKHQNGSRRHLVACEHVFFPARYVHL